MKDVKDVPLTSLRYFVSLTSSFCLMFPENPTEISNIGWVAYQTNSNYFFLACMEGGLSLFGIHIMVVVLKCVLV